MSEKNEQPGWASQVRTALGVDFNVVEWPESGLNITPVFPTFVWGRGYKPTSKNVAGFLTDVASSLRQEAQRFDERAIALAEKEAF